MICVPSVDILTGARLVNTNADTNESESGQFRGSQIDVAVLFASCIQRIPQSNTVWNRFAVRRVNTSYSTVVRRHVPQSRCHLLL